MCPGIVKVLAHAKLAMPQESIMASESNMWSL
jgi:hypothetical protein